MNQRDIRSAIYLSGIKPVGYTVHHAIAGEEMELSVSSVSIGNAIVRCLRHRAMLAFRKSPPSGGRPPIRFNDSRAR